MTVPFSAYSSEKIFPSERILPIKAVSEYGIRSFILLEVSGRFSDIHSRSLSKPYLFFALMRTVVLF